MSDRDNTPGAADSSALSDADGHEAVELLATISHELRSPLAVINGYAATLLRHDGRLRGQERREYLAAIVEASEHMRRLLERALRLAELENGSARAYMMPLDLAKIAEAAVSDMRTGTASGHAFNVRLDAPSSAGTRPTPWFVRGDPRLLREVLDNLLENAVKYSPAGSDVVVTLRPALRETNARGAARHEHGHGRDRASHVELIVSDRGVGLAEGSLERIFERFHRVDDGLTRESGGMGLGLALCRSIVARHDGLIWAENRPEGGSAFHVILPAWDEHDDVTAEL